MRHNSPQAVKMVLKCLFPKRQLQINIFLFSVVFSLFCFFPLRSAEAATELAKINGVTISLEEFSKRYKENLKFFQVAPPTKLSVLDDIIKRELGIQEAKRLGLDKDPEVIQRINTVLYHALLEKKLSQEFGKIRISEKDAQTYYEKNPVLRTSHIFVGVKPDAPETQQKQALEKISQIKKNYLDPGKVRFSEVAQKYSEGPAAPMGGDIDFQNKSQLDPVYYRAALACGSVGKMSPIVRTQFGYHIIQLTAIRPWSEMDHGDVKRWAFEEQRSSVFEAYMDSLRKTAQVTVHKNLLQETSQQKASHEKKN